MYSTGQKPQRRSDNNNASGTTSNAPPRPINNSGGGGPRHMACKACRDRKVRCDGGQPACEKCQRASEECIYTAGSRKTKTDLVETMEMLQERLGTVAPTHSLSQQQRAESALAARDTMARNGSFRSGSSSASSFLPPFDPMATWPCQPQPTSSPVQSILNPQYMAARRPLQISDLSMMPSGSIPFIPDTSIDPGTNLTMSSDDSMFTSMPGSTTITDPSYSYGSFAAPTMKDQGHWPNQEHGKTQDVPSTSQLPNRQDIRKWNAAQQDQQQLSDTTRPSTPAGVKILTHFAEFAKTMGGISADIAGVALTLADYLAWVRKKPDQCQDRILEIFEARAREIAEMAASKTAAATEEATASSANIAGPENYLIRAEAEIARIHQEKVEFFHSGYEIQRSLAEQCE